MKKKGFNKYEVNGDVTTIYFDNYKNKIIAEGYIDTEDLEKIKSMDYIGQLIGMKFLKIIMQKLMNTIMKTVKGK